MSRNRSNKHTADLSHFPPIPTIRADLVAIKDKILGASNLYTLTNYEQDDVRIVINTLIYILDNYQRDDFKNSNTVILWDVNLDSKEIKAYPNESYAPIHLENHPTGEVRIACLLRTLVVQFTTAFHLLDALDPTRVNLYVKTFCGSLHGHCIDMRTGQAFEYVEMREREDFSSLMQQIGKQYPSYFDAIGQLLNHSTWNKKTFIADSGKNAFYKSGGRVDEKSFPFIAQFLAEKSHLTVNNDFYTHYKKTPNLQVHLFFYGFLLQHDFIDELLSKDRSSLEEDEFDLLVCPQYPHRDLLIVALEQLKDLIQNTDPNKVNPLDFDPEAKQHGEEKAKVDPKRVEQRVKETTQRLEAHRKTFVNLIKLTTPRALIKWFDKLDPSNVLIRDAFSTYLSVQNILDILPFLLKACNTPAVTNNDPVTAHGRCQKLILLLVGANFFESLNSRSSFETDFKYVQDTFQKEFTRRPGAPEEKSLTSDSLLKDWISAYLKKEFYNSQPTTAIAASMLLLTIFTNLTPSVLKMLLTSDMAFFTQIFKVISSNGEPANAWLLMEVITTLLEQQDRMNRPIVLVYENVKTMIQDLQESLPAVSQEAALSMLDNTRERIEKSFFTNDIFSLTIQLQIYLNEDKLNYFFRLYLNQIPREQLAYIVTPKLISHALRFLKQQDFIELCYQISTRLTPIEIANLMQNIKLTDDIPKSNINTLINNFSHKISPHIIVAICLSAPNKLAALMKFVSAFAHLPSQPSPFSNNPKQSYLDCFVRDATPKIILTLPNGQSEFVAYVANALIPLNGNETNLKILTSFPTEIIMAIIGARNTRTRQLIHTQAIIDACKQSDPLFITAIHNILNQLEREQKTELLQRSPLLRLLAEHMDENEVLRILRIIIGWSKSNLDLVRSIFSSTGALLLLVEQRKIKCLTAIVGELDSESLLGLIENDNLLGNMAYHFNTLEFSEFLEKNVKLKLSAVQYKSALHKIVLHAETSEAAMQCLLQHCHGVLTPTEIITVFLTSPNHFSALKFIVYLYENHFLTPNELKSYITKVIAKFPPLDLNAKQKPEELTLLLSILSTQISPALMAEICLEAADKLTSFLAFIAIVETQSVLATADEKSSHGNNYTKNFIAAALPDVIQHLGGEANLVTALKSFFTTLNNRSLATLVYFNVGIFMAILDSKANNTNHFIHQQTISDLFSIPHNKMLIEILTEVFRLLGQSNQESLLNTSYLLRVIAEYAEEKDSTNLLLTVIRWNKPDLIQTLFKSTDDFKLLLVKNNIRCFTSLIGALNPVDLFALLNKNTLLSNAARYLGTDQLADFLMQIKSILTQQEYESILKKLSLHADTSADNVMCLLHCSHRNLSAEEMATLFLTAYDRFSIFKPFIETIDTLPSVSSVSTRKDEQKQENFKSQDYFSRFIKASAPNIIASLTQQDNIDDDDTRFSVHQFITMACAQLHAEEKETDRYATGLLTSIRNCPILSLEQKFEYIVLFPQETIIDALRNQKDEGKKFLYNVIVFAVDFDITKGKNLIQSVLNDPLLNPLFNLVRVPILKKLYETAKVNNKLAKECISKLIGYLENQKINQKRVAFAIQTIFSLVNDPIDKLELAAIQKSVLAEHGRSLFKSEIATYINIYLVESNKKPELGVPQQVMVSQ
ncbi:MAG: hypothetical protein ABI597_11465 [Gammaproteobacteria bacterium]